MRTAKKIVLILLALASAVTELLPQTSQRAPSEEQLKVQVAVDHPSLAYVEDDTLRITLTTNKDCYLRLIYSDANGIDVIIFPNHKHRDDRVTGGIEYSVPTKFQVTTPFGKEVLHAFVSSEKFSGFDGEDRGDGLFILREPLAEVLRKLRAGSIFGEYAEQKLEITTAARKPVAQIEEPPPASLPQITFSKPGSSDYVLSQADSVLIEGDIEGSNAVPPVTINEMDVSTKPAQETLHFRWSTRLQLGENKFEVKVKLKDGRTTDKLLIIKREEHKFAGQRWAVVVGISKYSNPGIPSLRYAHRDAEAFYDFLKSPNGGAFPDDHLMILTNEKATKAGVENAIFDFLKQTKKDDLVMIFFSGHGLSRGKGYSYFVTHDTDLLRIEETAFNMEEVRRALRTSISAERVLIFADACYSGAVNDYVKGTRGVAEENLINRYLVEMAKVKPGIISITSCAENEVSNEAWLYWEHGIFTFVLVSGLGGKITDTQGKVKSFESADANQDGIVTVGELSAYLSKYVPGYTKNKQNPQISKSNFDPNTPLSVVR